MGTSYPGALDEFTNPQADDGMNLPSHAAQHANANDAIAAIQAELGTNPSGSYDTVKDRLAALAGGGGGGGVGGGLALITSDVFTAVSSLSLPDDVFSTDYDDYKLLFVPTAYSAAGAVATSARFRASGVDDSSAIYAWARSYSYNGGAGDSGTVADSKVVVGDSGAGALHRCVFEIQSPHLAETTSLACTTTMDQGSGYFIFQTLGAHVRASTVFDSLTIYVSDGTFTGRWALYGYAK
jgi:hypothetical protein